MRYGPTPDYSYWSSTPALRCRVLVTWDRLELPHRYAAGLKLVPGPAGALVPESPKQPVGRWIVEPRTRDASGRIRWYCLRWTGGRLSYLRDGFRSGSYRFKRDALRAAAGLNRSVSGVTP